MELTVTTTREGWRIRTNKPGQRVVRYLAGGMFATEAEALAEIERIRGGFHETQLGVQWYSVTTTTAAVELDYLAGLVRAEPSGSAFSMPARGRLRGKGENYGKQDRTD